MDRGTDNNEDGKGLWSLPGAETLESASDNKFSSDGLWVGSGRQRRAAWRHATSRATARQSRLPFNLEMTVRAPMLSPWTTNGVPEGAQSSRATKEATHSHKVWKPESPTVALKRASVAGSHVPEAQCVGDPWSVHTAPHPQGQASKLIPRGPATRCGLGSGDTTR